MNVLHRHDIDTRKDTMNTIIRHDILYIYRNEEVMLTAYTGSYGGHNMMYSADYAFQLDRSSEFDYCKVLKDRSGLFSQNTSIPLKKVLKVVKILQEDN